MYIYNLTVDLQKTLDQLLVPGTQLVAKKLLGSQKIHFVGHLSGSVG